MQGITMFKTDSGKLFTEEADAIKWEGLCAEVKEVMRPLGKKPADPDCNFANGDGFIQHDPGLRDHLSHALVQLAKAYRPRFGQEGGIDYTRDTTVNSIVGRALCDSDLTVVYRAWSRLMCIDSLGREWGQSYYAYYPDNGKHRVIKNSQEIN